MEKIKEEQKPKEEEKPRKFLHSMSMPDIGNMTRDQKKRFKLPTTLWALVEIESGKTVALSKHDEVSRLHRRLEGRSKRGRRKPAKYIIKSIDMTKRDALG